MNGDNDHSNAVVVYFFFQHDTLITIDMRNNDNVFGNLARHHSEQK